MVFSQENSCCDTEIFQFWVENVLFKYIIKNNNQRHLLIYDRAPSHKSIQIKQLLLKNNVSGILIPLGFTRFLQPFDVSINKPFKTYFIKKFIEFQLDNLNLYGNKNNINDNMFRNNIQQNKEVTEKEPIDWLYNKWYDESLISKEIIYNSFKYCGISNSLDGCEDDIFNWPTDKEFESDLIVKDLNELEENSKVFDFDEDNILE